jgi:hypothetical protein
MSNSATGESAVSWNGDDGTWNADEGLGAVVSLMTGHARRN